MPAIVARSVIASRNADPPVKIWQIQPCIHIKNMIYVLRDNKKRCADLWNPKCREWAMCETVCEIHHDDKQVQLYISLANRDRFWGLTGRAEDRQGSCRLVLGLSLHNVDHIHRCSRRTSLKRVNTCTHQRWSDRCVPQHWNHNTSTVRTWYKIRRHGNESLNTDFLANSRSRSLYVIVRQSVCRLSVASNVRAAYSGDWNFRQCFYAIW